MIHLIMIMAQVDEVKVRLAQAEDREAVLAFCQNTWENHSDYIHLIWDQWFAAPQGRIFVAVVNDIPVGIARVVQMTDSEAWWEGLRVAPAYRGRGIASILESQIEQFVLEANLKISRTCNASDNTIRNKMMARRGGRKVGSYIYHQAISIAHGNGDQVTQLVQLNFQDFNSIWELVNDFEFLSENPCLYVSRGAKWQELTPHLLKNCLEQGWVWGCQQNDELINLAIQSHSETSQKTFYLGYVNGKPETMGILLLELRQLAFEKGYSAVEGFFPVRDHLLKSLAKAGYQEGNLGDFWVYQWQNC